MKKKLLFALVGVALLLAAGGYVAKKAGSKKQTQYDTSEVKIGNVLVTINAAGTVYANREVEIKAKASGEIVELPFDVGDVVRQKELLVKLDPVDEQRSLDRAEIETTSSLAQLNQAKLDVERAERDLKTDHSRALASLSSARSRGTDRRQKAERVQTLFEKKLASQEELETANAEAAAASSDEENAEIRLKEIETEQINIDRLKEQVVLAESNYNQAQISLLDAKRRLEETQIFSPIDGVVSSLNVQIGQIISSAISNVGGGTALMVVSDLSRILVYASVDESDIGSIELGQKVIVTADGFPDEVFDGKVERIAVKGAEVSNVVTFETRIEIVSENRLKLKPQMTVNASIVLDERDDVIVVPTEAILTEGDKEQVEVYVSEGVVEKQPVTVGLSDGIVTEILSGVKPGVKVVKQGIVKSRWQTPNSSEKTQRRTPPPPPGL